MSVFFLLSAELVEGAPLSGGVKDESGGVVASATVTIMTARNAIVATATTDTTGAFTIPALEPGTYLAQPFEPAWWCRPPIPGRSW